MSRMHRNKLKKWHYFYPPIHIFLLLTLLNPILGYLILVPEQTLEGTIIFNATLPRLGKSRLYSLNVNKNGHFVKKLLGVDQTTGEVFLKEKLDCRGIWYPNLFTIHVDSVQETYKASAKRRSTRNHDFLGFFEAFKKGKLPEFLISQENKKKVNKVVGVKYYSMPLRVFVVGKACNKEDVNSPHLDEEHQHHESK